MVSVSLTGYVRVRLDGLMAPSPATPGATMLSPSSARPSSLARSTPSYPQRSMGGRPDGLMAPSPAPLLWVTMPSMSEFNMALALQTASLGESPRAEPHDCSRGLMVMARQGGQCHHRAWDVFNCQLGLLPLPLPQQEGGLLWLNTVPPQHSSAGNGTLAESLVCPAS